MGHVSRDAPQGGFRHIPDRICGRLAVPGRQGNARPCRGNQQMHNQRAKLLADIVRNGSFR
jgi:hypothetical protein